MIVVILVVTTVASIVKTRRDPELRAHAGSLRAIREIPRAPGVVPQHADRQERARVLRLVAELARHVGDERVLAAVAAVPRDRFVPPELRDEAWANAPLPIGESQTISQPLVVARMCELLQLDPSDRVLDVGTGSGYHAALLAKLAAHVWSVERHRDLAEQARENLAAAGVDNVTLIVGDGSRGYELAAPYDAINVAAAAWGRIPEALEEQLAPGGRLVAPVDGHGQRLVLVRRGSSGLSRQWLEPVGSSRSCAHDGTPPSRRRPLRGAGRLRRVRCAPRPPGRWSRATTCSTAPAPPVRCCSRRRGARKCSWRRRSPSTSGSRSAGRACSRR